MPRFALDADLTRLHTALALHGPAPAALLAKVLGVSVPTLHRLLHRLPAGQWLSAGQARRSRHAARRPLRGVLGDWPVYAIDESGQAQPLAPLAPLASHGCWMPLAGGIWPVPEEVRDGWWPGLPYPLYDMRPQGYMGRQFARAEHAALGVSPNPEHWSDDDVLHVLSQRGVDTSGNWLLGDAAYARWQAARLHLPAALSPADTPAAYVALADQAVALGGAGSSAAGEFPKFAARRSLPPPEAAASGTPHVLVKFSGAGDSPAERRWADLLTCEHLALAHAGRALGDLADGLWRAPAAASRVLRHAGRTFLEVERFDRHGEHGRSPLISLHALHATFVGGAPGEWPAMTAPLVAAGVLHAAAQPAIERLWWFGRLIGNADMHPGNLSFVPWQSGAPLKLAPVYDMLPMLHAPLAGGELPARPFEPPLPLPPQREHWHAACQAALAFWGAAASHPHISPAFAELCVRHAGQLRAVRTHA